MTDFKQDTDNKDKVERVIELINDPKMSFTDGEREDYVRAIKEQVELDEREVLQLGKLKEQLSERLKSTYKEIDGLDDDKASCDRKIKEITKQLEENGDELLEKRLKSVQEERDVLEELIKSRVSLCESIGSQSMAYEKEESELILGIQTMRKSIVALNGKMMEDRVKQAKRDAKERVERMTSRENNPLLDALNMLFDTIKGTRLTGRMVSEAIREEEKKQHMNASNSSFHADGQLAGNKEDSFSGKDVDGSCVSVAVRENGRTDIKILAPKEFEEYVLSEEGLSLRKKIEQEKDLANEEKTVSVVISRHEGRSSLMEKLRPIVGDGVHNADRIGSYANTPKRQDLLLRAISGDCTAFEKLGGTALDASFRRVGADVESEQARHKEPSLVTHKVIAHSSLIDPDEIPWNQLRSFNLSKKSLSQKNIDSLIKGGVTDVITVTGSSSKGKKIERSFKLMLVTDKNGDVTFRKLPVLPMSNIDRREKLGDGEFSETDKDMLKRYGQLNHLVPFTEDGKTKMLMVGLDKETNTLFICDPKKIKLPKFISEQCTRDELKRLYNGNPVHLHNLIDDAGLKFSGWVVLSPHGNGQVRHLRHIDNDFKAQVRNNNYGERTEELKEDKDAKVKSKQNRSDDGVTSERKAYDFSTDSNGTTQRERTYKTTKNI